MVLNAAIFILMEIAALGMLRHNGQMQGIWISKGLHAFSALVWGKTESIKDYFSLRKENQRLSEENFRLRQEIRFMHEHATDTAGMAEAMYTGKIGTFRYISADVVKISNNRQHNYLILDKGSDDGIVPQSGVITPQGAIGLVDAVSRNYSYVLSFKNTEMTISARIGREGAVGPLTWDGIRSNGAILKEIPHHIVFEKGDSVFTSGLSSLYPPDIPLGTIQDTRIVNGATYEIKVMLLEDFMTLRHVTVAENLDRGEINELVKEKR